MKLPWKAGGRASAALALLLLPLASCNVEDFAVADDDTQTWVFYSEGGAVTVDCLPGGACTYASGAWVADFNGCQVNMNFDVQFSGSAVRLLLFRKGAGTTCGSVTMSVTGTGTANAAYPRATEAMGTAFASYQTPGGAMTGSGSWSAARID